MWNCRRPQRKALVRWLNPSLVSLAAILGLGSGERAARGAFWLVNQRYWNRVAQHNAADRVLNIDTLQLGEPKLATIHNTPAGSQNACETRGTTVLTYRGENLPARVPRDGVAAETLSRNQGPALALRWSAVGPSRRDPLGSSDRLLIEVSTKP